MLQCEHFDDVPVEFLPEMLMSQKYSEYYLGESVHPKYVNDIPPKHDEDVNSLSVMYEIVKLWDKSLTVSESLSIQKE